MIIPLGTVQFVQLVSFDSFYVTDSPLSVTKIAELANFYCLFMLTHVTFMFISTVHVSCTLCTLHLIYMHVTDLAL